jgi:hypothetical protein
LCGKTEYTAAVMEKQEQDGRRRAMIRNSPEGPARFEPAGNDAERRLFFVPGDKTKGRPEK